MTHDQFDEFEKAFNSRVRFLRNNIPLDDIYDFTEEALMAADFFLKKWAEHTSISDEIADSKEAYVWVSNIVNLRKLYKNGHNEGISRCWGEE